MTIFIDNITIKLTQRMESTIRLIVLIKMLTAMKLTALVIFNQYYIYYPTTCDVGVLNVIADSK